MENLSQLEKSLNLLSQLVMKHNELCNLYENGTIKNIAIIHENSQNILRLWHEITRLIISENIAREQKLYIEETKMLRQLELDALRLELMNLPPQLLGDNE